MSINFFCFTILVISFTQFQQAQITCWISAYTDIYDSFEPYNFTHTEVQF